MVVIDRIKGFFGAGTSAVKQAFAVSWLPALSLLVWGVIVWFFGFDIMRQVFFTGVSIGRNLGLMLLALVAVTIVGRYIFTGAYKRRMNFGEIALLVLFPIDMFRWAITRKRVVRQGRGGDASGSSNDTSANGGTAAGKPFYKRPSFIIAVAVFVVATLSMVYMAYLVVNTVVLSLVLLFQVWVTGALVWYVVGGCFLESPGLGLIKAALWFVEVFGFDIGANRRVRQEVNAQV